MTISDSVSFCHFAQRKINLPFVHFVVQSGWLRKTQVNLSPLSLRFAEQNQNIRFIICMCRISANAFTYIVCYSIYT